MRVAVSVLAPCIPPSEIRMMTEHSFCSATACCWLGVSCCSKSDISLSLSSFSLLVSASLAPVAFSCMRSLALASSSVMSSWGAGSGCCPRASSAACPCIWSSSLRMRERSGIGMLHWSVARFLAARSSVASRCAVMLVSGCVLRGCCSSGCVCPIPFCPSPLLLLRVVLRSCSCVVLHAPSLAGCCGAALIPCWVVAPVGSVVCGAVGVVSVVD